MIRAAGTADAPFVVSAALLQRIADVNNTGTQLVGGREYAVVREDGGRTVVFCAVTDGAA